MNNIEDIASILEMLLVFPFEISGKDVNEFLSINRFNILFTLLAFHRDILGKDFNELHLLNIQTILLILFYSILEYLAIILMNYIH